MKIKYLAGLAQITGIAEEDWPIQPTVLALLLDLAKTFGSPLDRLLLNEKNDDMGDQVFILLNGQHIRNLKGVQTILRDSDEICLIPVIEAG